MLPLIVSHTRTGTQYLAMLLYRNFRLGIDDYEKLHFSHSRRPSVPYIHLHRPVLPVMLSIWMCREHLGIHSDVSFSQMIRTPWEDMPRSSTCVAFFNGERNDKVCPPRDFEGTLLDRYLEYTARFERDCTLSIAYRDAVDRPMYVLKRVAVLFNLQPQPFVPVLERIGWWAPRGELPTVTHDDAVLMEEYQCRSSTL